MARTRSKHAADSGTARAAHPTCAHSKAIQSGLATYAIRPQPLTCARAVFTRRHCDALTPATANLCARCTQRPSAPRRTNARNRESTRAVLSARRLHDALTPATANLCALRSAPVGSATHKCPQPLTCARCTQRPSAPRRTNALNRESTRAVFSTRRLRDAQTHAIANLCALRSAPVGSATHKCPQPLTCTRCTQRLSAPRRANARPLMQHSLHPGTGVSSCRQVSRALRLSPPASRSVSHMA